jgi:chemotaxis protein CheX
MTTLKDISFNDLVTHAVEDVLATMLSMKAEPLSSNSSVNFDGERIVGSVGFAGKVVGAIYIHVSAEFARLMTAALLSLKLEEVPEEDSVNDVIGEMSNMIGGSLKSHLCDAGFACALSIPSPATISFSIGQKPGSCGNGFDSRLVPSSSRGSLPSHHFPFSPGITSNGQFTSDFWPVPNEVEGLSPCPKPSGGILSPTTILFRAEKWRYCRMFSQPSHNSRGGWFCSLSPEGRRG